MSVMDEVRLGGATNRTCFHGTLFQAGGVLTVKVDSLRSLLPVAQNEASYRVLILCTKSSRLHPVALFLTEFSPSHPKKKRTIGPTQSTSPMQGTIHFH